MPAKWRWDHMTGPLAHLSDPHQLLSVCSKVFHDSISMEDRQCIFKKKKKKTLLLPWKMLSPTAPRWDASVWASQPLRLVSGHSVQLTMKFPGNQMMCSPSASQSSQSRIVMTQKASDCYWLPSEAAQGRHSEGSVVDSRKCEGGPETSLGGKQYFAEERTRD